MGTSECCAREKYWGELTHEERIERLASNLYNLIRREVESGDKVRKLSKHSHSPNGEIVVPLKDACPIGSGGGDYIYDSLRRTEEKK